MIIKKKKKDIKSLYEGKRFKIVGGVNDRVFTSSVIDENLINVSWLYKENDERTRENVTYKIDDINEFFSTGQWKMYYD